VVVTHERQIFIFIVVYIFLFIIEFVHSGTYTQKKMKHSIT